jgi:hypothetical protein
MAWLFEELARDHPGATLHVIQPPYHVGWPPSAGTHDKDACSDVWIFGLEPRVAERWLRAHGFWCWWRHTGTWADPPDWHHHGFTAPADGHHFAVPVGVYVDGGLSTQGRIVASSQIQDAHNRAQGLSGLHAPGCDPAPWPPEPYPRFNLAAYVKHKEQETMEYKDWSDASKRQFAADVAKVVAAGNQDLLATQVSVRTNDNTAFTKVTLKQAWARAANAVPFLRDKTTDLKDLIKKSDQDNATP